MITKKLLNATDENTLRPGKTAAGVFHGKKFLLKRSHYGFSRHSVDGCPLVNCIIKIG